MQEYDATKLRDVSIPLENIAAQAGLLAVLLLILPMLPHIFRWGFVGFEARGYLLGFIATLALIVAHELVHAVGWMVFGRVPRAEVQFGFAWRTFSPYVHIERPIRADAYRIGAALPLFVTGLFPVILGTLTNQGWLTVAGAILVSGAVGDILVLWVIRDIPADAKVLDHPKNAGCYVVEE